jgi:PAS domain S-box-containing protein
MEKPNLPAKRQPKLLIKYTAAIALVLIAFFVTVQLRAHFEQTPNSLFFCAVILAAWYGGFGPGLLAGVLSVAAIEGFLRPPDVAFEMDASELSRSVVFLFATFLISWICSKQKLGAELLGQARDELEAKVEERTKDLRRVNEELRRSETYLTEGQRLSHTGSWAWNHPTRDRVYWSREQFRIYGFNPEMATAPYQEARTRIHPDDRTRYDLSLESAIHEKRDFELELRLVLPDKSMRHLYIVGHPVFNESGEIAQFIGTTMDVTERKEADETLRKTEADLARVARATTLGELTASIAHEVNQPIAAVVTNANACLRWLRGETPNLDKAREAAERIIRDGNRASDVIIRIRTLLKGGESDHKQVEINDVISEVAALAQGAVTLHRAYLQTDLASDLPPIWADRVQLQQVLLNLVANALDAMEMISDHPRIVRICSDRNQTETIRVTVKDSGIGLDSQQVEKLFEAFHTTKPEGLGMGLAISRSIIERHGGHLWAEANQGEPGAIFQFTLPITDGDET